MKHTVMKIGKDISEGEFKTEFPNARTVPQITNKISTGYIEYIGGHAEFKNWVLSKSLGEMTI